ncbi:hypothetical protein C7434_3054 [Pantoea sp. PNA 14-12]|nr:hypothetical protein C7434_3054 [Pantoea sp. PNA 14-12]
MEMGTNIIYAQLSHFYQMYMKFELMNHQIIREYIVNMIGA